MTHSSRKRRSRIICILVVLGVMLGAVGILRLGNPQWSKYIFMFQAYVWPGTDPNPPDNFTGTWLTWYKNAQMMNKIPFKNGGIDGEERAWHPNGQPWWLVTYKVDRMHGPTYMWNQQGRKTLEGSYDRQRQHGKWTRWDDDGKVILEEWYLYGKQVTNQEYQQAARDEEHDNSL